MAYTDSTKVLRLMPELNVGPTAAVTPTDIDTLYIPQIEAEIEGILEDQGYSPIPATNTRAVTLLEGYVTKKVAATVYMVLFKPKLAPDFIRTWETDYEQFLNRLRQGQQRIPGGVVQSEGGYSPTVNVGVFKIGRDE